VLARAQKWGARALRAVPERWIAPLAGAPTVIRGRTLDPHVALVTRAAHPPALHTLAPLEARAQVRRMLALAAPPLRPLERIEEHRVPGVAGDLAARLYAPHDLDGPRPLVLYFHAGGFVVGDLDSCEAFCSVIASRARCPVLSIDYRKGPEHRFPAAQDDAWSVYRFALEHAGRFGGDPARIAVAGDSAGGGLAAMVAQRARTESVRAPSLQLLVYPWLVASVDNAAYRDFGACPPLLREDLPWFLAIMRTRSDRRATCGSRRASRASSTARARARLHRGLRRAVRRGRGVCAAARRRGRAGRVPLLRVAAARVHGPRGHVAPAAALRSTRSRATSISCSREELVTRIKTASLWLMAAFYAARAEPLPRARVLSADHAALPAVARGARVPLRRRRGDDRRRPLDPAHARARGVGRDRAARSRSIPRTSTWRSPTCRSATRRTRRA
jgi:acetyl esterase/lipase